MAIASLAGQLAQAGAAADWDRLGELAAALPGQLRALAARGVWTAAEQAALARLRGAHDDAALTGAQALDALAARLADMRNNKDGWVAYALAGDHADHSASLKSDT